MVAVRRLAVRCGGPCVSEPFHSGNIIVDGRPIRGNTVSSATPPQPSTHAKTGLLRDHVFPTQSPISHGRRPLSAMSTKRVPLSANPNAANSPLRAAAAMAAASAAKHRRSHASTQREDAYGQPPPAKRQMLDAGTRGAVKSPAKVRVPAQRGTGRGFPAERPSQTSVASAHKPTEREVEEIRKWQQSLRARFPKLVFYFESVPDDQRVRLAKQVSILGAVSS